MNLARDLFLLASSSSHPSGYSVKEWCSGCRSGETIRRKVTSWPELELPHAAAAQLRNDAALLQTSTCCHLLHLVRVLFAFQLELPTLASFLHLLLVSCRRSVRLVSSPKQGQARSHNYWPHHGEYRRAIAVPGNSDLLSS